MQKALEKALDRAECIIESAQQRPPKRKCLSSGEKSLHDKLYDIYVEECGKEPEVAEELTSNVNLLEKLVKRESLPCLVVNLYPGKEGYSLMLKGENEICTETIQLPYEEGEFLEYLDAEQLPPVLVDLLEKSQVNIFHRGCVIAEIRDYRQCSDVEPPGYQSRHILLRPTMQTLASDIHSITGDNQVWTQEDKLELESQLILATAEPLCLDPSISVACTENRLLYNKQKMNTPPMRRNFKRYSTASLNRHQEPSCSPLPPELRVWDFHKVSKEGQAGQQYDLKLPKAGSCVDTWKQPPCDLVVPSEVDVEKYAKLESSVNYDASQPTFWPAQEEEDDILFRYEAGDQSQTAKLPFMKSLKDPLVSGKRPRKNVRFVRQMTPHHSFTDDYVNIVMPWSNTEDETEVSPFKELVQESIPSPIQVPQGSSGSASLSQSFPERETEWPQEGSVQSLVPGEAARHTPPHLSPPSRSGNTTSGDSFTPQQASSPHISPSPAPASIPLSLPQMSPAEVNRANALPAATLSTSSSSQTAPASQVKATYPCPSVTKMEDPVHAARTVVRSSKYLKGPFARTRAPVAIRPKGVPSGDEQPQNIEPTVPQTPSQRIQLIFKNVSGVRPITIIQLPPGSVILNIQQQPEQQPQQPQFCQLIPQFQSPIFHIQQPVSQGLNAQRSAPQRLILPAIMNPGGAESVPQTERAVLPQPGSAQTRSGQGLPQQTVQLPSAEQGLPLHMAQLPSAEQGLPQHTAPLPSAEQGLPLHMAQLPSAEQGLPQHIAQLPSAEQGLPLHMAQLPSAEQGLPLHMAQLPSAGQGLPQHMAQLPSAEQGLPQHTTLLPSAEQGLPQHRAQLPSAEQGLPFHMAQLPSAEQGLPFHMAQLPSAGQGLPLHMAQLPSAEQGLPLHMAQLPSAEQGLPQHMAQFPSAGQGLPQHMAQLPSAGQGLPQHMAQLPSAGQGLPQHMAQLPSAEQGLPQHMAQLPSAEQGLPFHMAQLPSAGQGLPQHRAQLPSAGQGLPQHMAQLPSAEQGLPQHMAQLPSAEQGLPFHMAQLPSAGQGLPQHMAQLPSAEQGLPQHMAQLPSAGQGLPQHMAQLPSARQGLPQHRAQLPSAGQGLPLHMAQLPSAGEGLPLHMAQLPSAEQGFPQHMAQLPSAEQGLPQHTAQLPSAGQGLPLHTAQLPSSGQGLPQHRAQLPSAGQGLPQQKAQLLSAEQGLPQKKAQLLSAEQGLPQRRAQLSSAFMLQPQRVPLRILQLPVAVSTVATQPAQSHSGQQTASQSEGNMNRDPPTNTKF